MKKLLFILAIFITAVQLRAQTVSEITNILNTKPQSVSTSAVTANANNLFSLDLSSTGYRSINITITGTWSATVEFQASNDNFTTIDAIPVVQTTTLNPAWQTSTTANGTFKIFTLGYRYVRARTTAFTSGTINSTAYASINNDFPVTLNNSVTISGTASVNATLQTGSNQIGHLEANQTVDVNKIAGTTTATGNGTVSAGVQRVAIASDNTAFSVNAVQSGNWPVRLQDGSGNAINSTTNALHVNVQNSTIAVTKSGTWDITNAGTFAVQAASSTAPVNTMNSSSANSGLNAAIAGVFDDVSPTTLTENNFGFARMSNNHNLYFTLRDAGGNERGANVNSSNQLSVSVDNTVTVGSHAVTNAGTFAVQAASSTAPVNTMNSSSANSGLNSAIAGVFDDVSPTTLTENNFGFARMSNNHNLYFTLRDAAGNERGVNVTSANELLVSINNTSLAVTQSTSSNLKAQVDPLTVATWGLVAEDAAETAGNNLMGIGVVRRNAPVSSSSTDGENVTVNSGKQGALWVAEAAQHGGGADFTTGSIGATKTDIGTANTATSLYGYYFYNSNSSVAYVQFFNTQASGVTLGTTAPVLSLGIPATSGAHIEFPVPMHFSTALSIAITTTRAGSTGPSSTVDYNVFYKQ